MRTDRKAESAKFALLSTYLATPIRFVFVDAGFAGKLVDWTPGR